MPKHLVVILVLQSFSCWIVGEVTGREWNLFWSVNYFVYILIIQITAMMGTLWELCQVSIFFRYFRHASGSLVILSKNLVQYININRLVQCLRWEEKNLDWIWNYLLSWKLMGLLGHYNWKEHIYVLCFVCESVLKKVMRIYIVHKQHELSTVIKWDKTQNSIYWWNVGRSKSFSAHPEQQ